MLAVHPVVELVRALPALIGLLVAGTRSGQGGLWGLIGVVGAVGLGTVRWFTTRYRITRHQVQLRHGLLRRRELAVPLDRVRTVDVQATILHRLVGLTRLDIGTGRSDREKEHGLRLDGLTAGQADRLRDDLLHHRTDGPVAAAGDEHRTPARDLVIFDPAWIRYGPFTLTGLVTVVALAGLGWRAINESRVDVTRLGAVAAARHRLESSPAWLSGVQIVVALLIAVAVFSTLGYVLAFWGFRLTRTGEGTLHVRRGLLTTRAITLDERRLCGLELSEPLLLRMVGGARLIAIATGLRVGRGAERGGSILLPPAPRAEAVRVARDVRGEDAAITTALIPHGAAAARRRLVRALVPALLLAAGGVISAVLASAIWAVVAGAVLVALALLLGIDRARNLGHAVVGDDLVVREGTLVRRRAVLEIEAVVGVTLHSSWFQRRVGLTTLVAATAAGRQGYRVLDVGADVADALVQRLMSEAVRPFCVPAAGPSGATRRGEAWSPAAGRARTAPPEAVPYPPQ